jgi:fructose/tagatose bisphosphate aldolase
LNAAPGTIDPKKYNSEGRIEVEKYVLQKIEILGCIGKG